MKNITKWLEYIYIYIYIIARKNKDWRSIYLGLSILQRKWGGWYLISSHSGDCL